MILPVNHYETPMLRLLYLSVERGFELSGPNDDLKYEDGGSAWDE